ncbi:unnamed protein product [Pleuronectes platessa]|uniref:Uncharacterized protein n=1 Tax=Pleuronectes platessa TaxID=8262 RepID=A0A9N7YSQ0_PLEPL|nr:unnamed protein product [Pleuronectes platessa]
MSSEPIPVLPVIPVNRMPSLLPSRTDVICGSGGHSVTVGVELLSDGGDENENSVCGGADENRAVSQGTICVCIVPPELNEACFHQMLSRPGLNWRLHPPVIAAFALGTVDSFCHCPVSLCPCAVRPNLRGVSDVPGSGPTTPNPPPPHVSLSVVSPRPLPVPSVSSTHGHLPAVLPVSENIQRCR